MHLGAPNCSPRAGQPALAAASAPFCSPPGSSPRRATAAFAAGATGRAPPAPSAGRGDNLHSPLAYVGSLRVPPPRPALGAQDWSGHRLQDLRLGKLPAPGASLSFRKARRHADCRKGSCQLAGNGENCSGEKAGMRSLSIPPQPRREVPAFNPWSLGRLQG